MNGTWAVVEVRLGEDEHAYRFIVDSAAGKSVIDDKLAGRFVTKMRSDTVHGASGSAQDQGGTLGMLRVAGLKHRALSVAVHDMSRFGAKQGLHYDGILGNDVLRQYSYIFDVPMKRLTLLEQDRPDPRIWSACSNNPYAGRTGGDGGFVVTTLSFQSGGTATAIVDTAAGRTILNSAAAVVAGVTKSGHEGPGEISGIDGNNVGGYKVTVTGGAILNRQLAAFDASVSDLPVFGQFDISDRPAVIVGIGVLRRQAFAASRGGKHFCLSRSART